MNNSIVDKWAFDDPKQTFLINSLLLYNCRLLLLIIYNTSLLLRTIEYPPDSTRMKGRIQTQEWVIFNINRPT